MAFTAAAPEVSGSWKARLKQEGYAVFSKLVDQELIDAARRAIDDDMARHYDPAHYAEYEAQSYCPGLRKKHVITDLLEESAAKRVVDDVLGWRKISYGPGQIALRRAHSANRAFINPPHIDGVPTPANGLNRNALHTFTALVGIYLSPVTSEFAGNFTAWPGSHYKVEHYFQTRGVEAMQQGMPVINFGEPVQLKNEPGDVVLCNYQLAHSVAGNMSDHDRYAVYFRLEWKDIKDRRWELLTDVWNGWRL